MELTVYQNLFEQVMNILFLDKVRFYKQLISQYLVIKQYCLLYQPQAARPIA